MGKQRADGQTDGHTDGLSKTTFLGVLRVVRPKPGLIWKSIVMKFSGYLLLYNDTSAIDFGHDSAIRL